MTHTRTLNKYCMWKHKISLMHDVLTKGILCYKWYEKIYLLELCGHTLLF